MYSDPNLDAPPPRSQFRRPWSPEVFDPYPPSTSLSRDVDEYTTQSHPPPHTHTQHHDRDLGLYTTPTHLPDAADGDEGERVRSHGTSPHRRRRREASDVSVEALDLADYARTLRFRQAEDPYPPFPSQLTNGNGNGTGTGTGNGRRGRRSGLAPSSFPVIPSLPGSAGNSHDSFTVPRPPPPSSAMSRGPTLSSNTFSSTSRGRQSARRPFSMPVTPQASSSRVHFTSPNAHGHANGYAQRQSPYMVDTTDIRSSSTQDIDISRFPKWSRNWYNTTSTTKTPAARQDHADGDRDMDMYNPIPPSQFPYDANANTNTNTNQNHIKSPFDPGYIHDPYSNTTGFSSYDLPPPPPLSSLGHGSSRDVLPWSHDPPEYGPTLDPARKEERMRMLEREFGADAKGNGSGKGRGKGKNGKGREEGPPVILDDEGRLVVGTIDERGRLVTVGPKRRVVVRTLQILLAVGACVPALYAAVAIKPLDPKKPPPPANKPPVYVLYVVSVLTLLLLLYTFVVRPCCIVRAKPRKGVNGLGGMGGMGMGGMGMGMMVLPVGNDGKKKKKDKNGGGGGKKGKGKGKYAQAQGDVQVNLIVDPHAFNLPGGSSDSETEDDEEGYGYGYDSLEYDDGGMPGSYDPQQHQQWKQQQQHQAQAHAHAKRKKRRGRNRRRGLLEGLAMEEQWLVARAWLKKLTVLDVVGLVFWGAVFVFIVTGKRCPSGGFAGWCNAYNVSTASACLLCVAFGVSLFFDVQDLHASKMSPRTRMG